VTVTDPNWKPDPAKVAALLADHEADVLAQEMVVERLRQLVDDEERELDPSAASGGGDPRGLGEVRRRDSRGPPCGVGRGRVTARLRSHLDRLVTALGAATRGPWREGALPYVYAELLDGMPVVADCYGAADAAANLADEWLRDGSAPQQALALRTALACALPDDTERTEEA